MNIANTNCCRIALYVCGFASVVLPLNAVSQTQHDLAALVNPLVGTALSHLHDYGKTIPGAVRPFGMLCWSPDIGVQPFYMYETPVTRGFSLTHISGPGCGLYGDAPILPMLGVPGHSPVTNLYTATFSHTNEMAEPGYYEVTLDSGIQAKLAACLRSGVAEFRFPPGTDRHTLLIDLAHNLSKEIDYTEIQISNRLVTGLVSSGGICAHDVHYRVYFAMESDQTPEACGTFDKTGMVPGRPRAAGSRAGGYLSFDPSVQTIGLKVGVSFVSVANAEANLRSEIGERNLSAVRREARAAWNEALGRVRVRGGTDADRRIFYTALYHALLHPSVFNDVNGEYLGFDNAVHVARERTQYASFSGWDIYRCEVQLLAMLFPQEAGDMAQSLVVDAEQGGGLPIWPTANDDAHAMCGDPSDCILASMYAFGAQGFDAKAALAFMLRGANDPQVHSRKSPERPFLEEYLRQGFVGVRPKIYGGGSVTLEYRNADFAISRMAAALGDSATAQTFLDRSAQWRTLFDIETKYIRPRSTNGLFLPNFTPGNEAGFVEGNSAQYTWMIPYDLPGVITAVGGADEANKRLDNYFSKYYDYYMSGDIPYFAIGNEPSFGNPWIYNWTGRPWRTQEVVRKTLHDLFSAQPEGLPGNDDLGATSAWVVFAQLGLYPEIPGVGGLALNSPTFPEVTLRLAQHDLRIMAPEAPSKLYIKSVKLDGEPVRNWWIDWQRLSRASKLQFSLGAEPNRDPGQVPPAYPSLK